MPDSLDIRSPTDGMQRTPLPLTSPSLPSVRPCTSPFTLQLSLHESSEEFSVIPGACNQYVHTDCQHTTALSCCWGSACVCLR